MTKFLEQVSNHEIHVKLDTGVYRHLHFRDPRSGDRWFDITTWPNYLAFSGDMNTYVFHVYGDQDLLPIFRRKDQSINVDYWSTKCEAHERNSPIKKYSPKAFRHAVKDAVQEEDREVRRTVYDELFWLADNEHEAMRAIENFDQFDFSVFWEYDLTEYSYHFLWCCHAIVWGIRRYDEYVRLGEIL